jgi:flagellar biosynthesis GTPase FlhF
MKFSEYILENRVEDFKTKYGRKLNQDMLDRVVSMVAPKYLDWVGKILDGLVINDNFSEYITKIGPALKQFEKISSNLPKTDINQYQSLDELLESLKKYENRVRRNYNTVEGGVVVFENDRFFVVNPLTHKTSCYYGRGTKWCTAADSDDQFNRHNSDGKLFYILDKSLPTSDVNYKVALLQKFDGDSSFWNAVDTKMPGKWFEQHNPQSKEIIGAVNEYLESEFKEQLEIFKDKERAKKERERLEKLRIKRIIDQRIEEANERRAEGEWDLTNPYINEEALRAHAVFEYLEGEGDYQILTNQDRETIQSLKSEIERLNAEYDNSEDVRTDLLDSIETLEDELAEFDEYIDVYSLVPTGKHYDMTTFELANSLNETYAVGDSDETENSAIEYVEQLLDDVGYEGFNKNFVMNHLDVDKVVEHFRWFWDDDVRENPESYFEESQRDLSEEQKDKIKFINKKISEIEKIIENLEDELNDSEKERDESDIESDIEEMNSELEDLKTEIEEIEENPEGDFPDELIDEKVEEMLSDVRSSPNYYISEYGLDYKDFVDQDDFIQAVVDEDGYGIVNGYDGGYTEITIKDELFYVMRIE